MKRKLSESEFQTLQAELNEMGYIKLLSLLTKRKIFKMEDGMLGGAIIRWYFMRCINFGYNNTEDIPRLCRRRVLSFRSVGVQSPTERKRFYESPLLVKSRALNEIIEKNRR